MIYFHSRREILITISNGLFKVLYSFSPGHIIIAPGSLGTPRKQVVFPLPYCLMPSFPSQCWSV